MGYTLDWREVFATFTYLHIYKYIYIYIYFLKYIVKRALPGEGEWSPPCPFFSRETKKIRLTAKTKIILPNKKINEEGTSSINQCQQQNRKIIND